MDANPARVRCKEGVSWTGGHRAPQKVNFPLQCACAELLFAFLTHFFLPKKHFWPIFGGKMFWPGASPIVIFGAGQILLTQTAPLFRQRLPTLLDRRRGGLTPPPPLILNPAAHPQRTACLRPCRPVRVLCGFDGPEAEPVQV